MREAVFKIKRIEDLDDSIKRFEKDHEKELKGLVCCNSKADYRKTTEGDYNVFLGYK